MVGDQKSGQPTTAKPQLHDCMDERLMAADQAACVNMNLETLGKYWYLRGTNFRELFFL